MTINEPAVDVATRAEILDLDDQRWGDFVARHPDATPFHLPAWGRAVADCYRFRAFAPATVDAGDRVVAGVPVVEVRRPLGRRRWVSLPFTDHCPPLARSEGDAAVLVAALQRGVSDGHAREVELRGEVPGHAPTAGDPVAVRHVLPLDPDPQRVVAGFHRSQVQRNIRRAEREGVTVRRAEAASDVTEVFYGLHVRTRRRQGVPVQPRRFFELVWQRVLSRGGGHALVAEKDGVALAAAVFLTAGGRTVYKFGASEAEAWSLRPNHAIFARAITEACRLGVTEFDFGRTDLGHESLCAFKRSWGAAELPLHHTVLGPDGPVAATPGRALPAPAARLIQRGPEWVCRTSGALLYRWTA